jgi:hypothetical protein
MRKPSKQRKQAKRPDDARQLIQATRARLDEYERVQIPAARAKLDEYERMLDRAQARPKKGWLARLLAKLRRRKAPAALPAPRSPRSRTKTKRISH